MNPVNPTHRKYTALRTVSVLLKVISFLIAVVAILLAVVYFLAAQNGGQYINGFTVTNNGLASNLLVALGTAFVGLLLALIMYAAANQYDATIAMEENTRRTHELLEVLIARVTPTQRTVVQDRPVNMPPDRV